MIRLVWLIIILSIISAGISQVNHMYCFLNGENGYQRGGLFWVSQALGITCMGIDGCMLFCHRKSLKKWEAAELAAYTGLLALAMLLQIFVRRTALLCIASSICVFCIYIRMEKERSHRLYLKEKELERSRSLIMLTQIQPHFLFNSLTVIKVLCRTDPLKAELAVDFFSGFLHGNMDALTDPAMIPFSQELSHARHYLELEQIRYGERLRVEYHTPVRAFRLPSLTLQPIVENAVRYGIMKREEGGTISIVTLESEMDYIITVADDGVGFDVGKTCDAGRDHIGLYNVRSRLHMQCGGCLTIESIPEKGTTVIISIPKTEGQ